MRQILKFVILEPKFMIMKSIIQITLLFSFSFFIFNLSAQTNLKSDRAKQFTKKDLIVILTGNDTIDAFMKEAVQLKWEFSQNIQYMRMGDSKRLVENNPNHYLRMKLQLIQGIQVYEGIGGHEFMRSTYTYGDMTKIILFEDEDNASKRFEIALPSDYEFSRGVAIEGVQRTCHILNEIQKKGSWGKFFRSTKDSGLEKLKGLKLLVPLEYMKNQADTVKIKKKYEYPIYFVSTQEIHEIIESSKEGFAYLLVAEEHVNIHVHYVCTTSDSEVLAHYNKQVQSQVAITSGRNKHMYLDLIIFDKLFRNM